MPPIQLQLTPATDSDLTFCETLNRSNMDSYLLARGIAWDPERFRTSWREFENLLIAANGETVGLLRMLVIGTALEVRDLQLLPAHRGQGIGGWALAQAKARAIDRQLDELRLRVYTDNPALHLYTRFGFQPEATIAGVIHMSCRLPGPAQSARLTSP